MIKKAIVLLYLMIILAIFLCAQWETDISQWLESKDYKRATDFLLGCFEETSKIQRPDVCGLLAYSFGKLKDKRNEYRWVQQYFESYRGQDLNLNFLTISTWKDMNDYISGWKERYPLVTEMALIKSDVYYDNTPPSHISIGIDIKNMAYYKLSDETNVIKGGRFLQGFNSIQLEANSLFDRSGSHIYFLDLKTGDFILRKEIRIDIALDTEENKEKNETIAVARNPQYKLSMYIGDELVATRTSKFQQKLSLNIEKPPLPENYDPYDMVREDNPMANSASIFQALALAQEIIKSLSSKKDKEKRFDPLEKSQKIRTTFFRKDSGGIEREVSAEITLYTMNLDIHSTIIKRESSSPELNLTAVTFIVPNSSPS